LKFQHLFGFRQTFDLSIRNLNENKNEKLKLTKALGGLEKTNLGID
jgi:hypothetical protein